MDLPCELLVNMRKMGARTVPRLSVEAMAILDEVLLHDGHMVALPAEVLRALPHVTLQYWANERGRYQLVTQELVEWLRARIGANKCVEIGAGHGDVGRNVGGVTLTDSHFQTSDAMRLIYGGMQAKTITPPADVMKRDGVAAVRRYKPAMVLACWVTQLYQASDAWAPGKEATGSCYGGVDFASMLEHVGKEFIFVGNAEVHKGMRLLALPHEEYSFPWLVSRAHDQTLNRIWVWKGKQGGGGGNVCL